MPLEKLPLQLNFARGLDQKTDPLQVKPGRFLGLKNRLFNKEGRIDKRNGFGAFSRAVVNPTGSYTFSQIGNSVTAGRNVSPYTNELLLDDGLNLFSHSSASDNWVYKGRVEPCQTSEQSIYKNQANNIMPDSGLNPGVGLNVFAWESWTNDPNKGGSLNGVQISSIDSASGMTVLNAYLSSTTSRPKVIVAGSKNYVLYYDSNDSKLYARPLTQSGLGVAVALLTNMAAVPNYDAIVVGTTIYIAYSGTGSTVKVASFDQFLAPVATASKGEIGSNGVGVWSDTSNNIWVGYNNGSATKAFILDSTLVTTVLAPTTVDNSATGVLNVTGVYNGAGSVIFYDKPGSQKTGQATSVTVTSSFTQPAVGATVAASLSTDFSTFPYNNAIIYIPTGGYYYITGAIPGTLGILLNNLGLTGNASPGATVASTYQSVFPALGYQNSIVTFNTLNSSGSVGTAATLMRSSFLAGKAYVVNSVVHVITGTDSPLQATYFACALYNVNSQVSLPKGVCVAKLGASAGGGPPYRSILPAVNTVSTGIVQFAFPERTVEILKTSNNVSTVSYYLGVSSSQIDFTTNDIQTVDLGRNLQVGSGLLQMYDGASAAEQGFTIFPETVTATTGTSGDLAAGTYGYKVLYQWIDNLGQTHRSAPSPNVSVTLVAAPAAFTGNTTSGQPTITSVSTIVGLQVGMTLTGTGMPAGAYILSIDSSSQITISANATASNSGVTLTPGAANSIALTIPTLRITEKQNATIAIYRTAANGTTYFRLDTLYVTYPIANSISSDTVSFTDFSQDSQITGNEQLYTGEEVENIAPPATLAMTVYKNRVILIPSDNPYVWWYSKQVVNGSPVEFSDLFQQNMGTSGGPLVGVATLDDKLILFKGSSIYYVTGTGPGPSGANNDFSDPQFITADAGLLSPRSIVTTPVGLMFKSSKGIYLLDRSLQTKYIGKAVEDYNSYTVRGAQLIPKSNQVRFILSNGQCLMYDYFWTDEEGIGQWTVFDPVSAVSDCLFQNLHTYTDSTGVVYQETPAVYLDGAAGIATYFKTGWFNLAGLQGFERAYYFYLLAQYISSHTLTVNVYYDYDDTTIAQTLSITPVANELEQWRIFFTKMKCESFMIEVTEVGATGAGLTMSGLDVIVGVKKGYPKLKAANSAS